MSNLTIRPINTGYVTMIPKQYLYHHSTQAFYPDASDREEEYPVFAYLVEGGDKLLLIDTGMAYTERASKYHHHGSRQPEGMTIVEQLAKIGYKPEDIDIVVFTHLHWDHCFYIVMIIAIETGMITPPFGMNVFAVKSTLSNMKGMGDITIGEIFSGSMPYLLAMVVVDLICVFIPGVVTFLPSVM